MKKRFRNEKGQFANLELAINLILQELRSMLDIINYYRNIKDYLDFSFVNYSSCMVILNSKEIKLDRINKDTIDFVMWYSDNRACILSDYATRERLVNDCLDSLCAKELKCKKIEELKKQINVLEKEIQSTTQT